MSIFRKNYRRCNKGFTLLEMTVVLAIVVIMTAIVLMNLPQTKGGLSIDVVAQEVAIYIRGAQVYSRATKDARGLGYKSYGVHFNALPNKNNNFFLWADGNNSVNNVPPVWKWEPCPSGVTEECDPKQESYDLPAGFRISKLLCDSGFSRDEIDIVFKLPDPEANFYSPETADGLRSEINGCPDNFVSICLVSANMSQYRLIKTYTNGQIMVLNALDSKNICK